MKIINKCLLITTILLLIISKNIYAQTILNAGGWSLSGTSPEVNSIVEDANYIYLGGFFNSFVPFKGKDTKGAIVSTIGNGNVIPSPKTSFPNADRIEVAISDGTGGWFIGGAFTKVGGVTRNNIAHIKADKTLDMDWAPNVNGTVETMVLVGTDLFIGGEFTNISGESVNNIAKISTLGAGLADPFWDPFVYGKILCMVSSGTDLYVGGASSPSGTYLGKISITTGNDDPTWNPNPSVGSSIFTLALSGTSLYVGGTFTSIGGQARNRIAKLSTTGTGLADATWNPNASSAVYALAVSGSDLFVGGSFLNIGGQIRNYIAKLSTTGVGFADATWNPTASFDVYTMTLSGTDLYVGGVFSSIGGQLNQNYVAKLSTSGTGLADATWKPNPNNTVYTIAIFNTEAYIGGFFSDIGLVTRYNLARLNKSNLELDLNWSPLVIGGEINMLTLDNGNLYLGGSFTSVNGQTRNRIARMSTAGILDATWNPNANSVVNTFALSGTDLYVGGFFTNIGGQARNRIAKLSTSGTGLADGTWNPNANNEVYALAVSGTDLYVGGSFTNIGGQTRNDIAKLSTTGTGLADATWNPNILHGATGGVYEIVLSGTDLYVGGEFSLISGQTRTGLGKINTAGVLDATWNPNPTRSPSGIPKIYSLAFLGTDLYVGGLFTGIGGQSRNHLAKISTTGTGLADVIWNPNVTSSVGGVYDLLASGTDVLYAGGEFPRVAGLETESFVKFGACPLGSFSPSTLPNFLVGGYCNQYITQTGLVGANITWSITSGSLPTGVVLNTSLGLLIGTTSAAGTFNFTLNATDGLCSISQNYTIVVSACPTITFSNTSAGNAIIGAAYNLNAGATASPSATLSYTVSPALPAGLSLNASTGQITGTPTSLVATNTYTVSASVGACSASQNYTFAVVCPNITFNNTTASNATAGTAYTLNASVTGNTQSVFYSVSPALPAGLVLNLFSGQITGTPTTFTSANTYTVTASQSSGACVVSQSYTFAVNCPTATLNPSTLPNGTIGVAYSQTVTQTGLPTGAPTWSVSSGSLPTGLTLNSSTGVISGTPTTLGIFNFTIQATRNGCSASRAYTVVINCPVITFTNTTANNAVVGTAYTLNASVTGNTQTITYSVSPALPTGLSLNTSTGQISGTPSILTPANTYTITASQSSGNCTASQNYTFAVVCPTATLNPSILPNGIIGVAYNQAITQTGLPTGTIIWSVSSGSLPTGLSLNSSTGVISGTPTTIGTFSFTIEANNSGCVASRAYTVSINCPTITFSNTNVTDATVGTAYTLNASVTGNTQTVTYSISPALPTGLSLNSSTGIISGTPTNVVVATTYTIVASQSSGVCTASQNYTFAVNCAGVTLNPNSLPNANQSITYSQTLSQTGLSGTVTWSIITGSLPVGLSLNNSTGVISGIPTTLQTANFTIQVTNGVCSGSKAYSITVTQSGAIIEIITTDIDLGEVEIFSTSSKNLVVKNIGTAPLTITSITMPSAVFTSRISNLTSISPNESRNIELRFSPESVTTYNGTATINSNAISGGNTFTIRGKGLTPTALNSNQEPHMVISPNPTQEKVSIIFSKNVEKDAIQLLDSKGVILKNVLIERISTSEIHIDMKNLAQGVYFIKVGEFSQKIIKL
ncbi:MAG: putative Ig domain-containing protein [Raineya sp.]|jgi:hypothetical protein|nr:putative Ig domain-containing protein [Raineya sp.]